jgi:cytochrome c oxidase assembly protein subunit 15
MLHLYSRVVALATLLLIVAGAMVTSTGSGLAVPDWPTTYGHNMFTFPLSSMVGGIFYEHGHRLVASTVGLLTIVLAVWLWMRRGTPRWLRRLGVIALGAVILQGVLGGITVLYFLPAPVSIGHAGLAQVFFCLTISIALFTSPGWISSYARPGEAPAPVDDLRLRRVTLTTTILIYVQILLGATMRHAGAGLAIPDFPLAFGRLIPAEWNPSIAIHYAHRVGAVVAAAMVLAASRHVLRNHRSNPVLRRPAMLLVALVFLQITLGAFVIWTGKAVAVNSAHVATGAMVLGTSLVLTLRAHRVLFSTGAGAATADAPRRTATAAGTLAREQARAS